jgi:peptidoglycan/xylan/chitin deacetylase (PgdA/CDA1 family)
VTTAPGQARPLPPLVVHVDLDGASTIFRAHGREFRGSADPLFDTGMRNMLEVFGRAGVQATLFVIADDLRDAGKRALVAAARDAGHEIASHSMTHPNLRRLGAAAVRSEISDSRRSIQDALGVPVHGFRAPGYSIDREGLGCLAEAGYSWDSSAFATPAFTERLGLPVGGLDGPRTLPGFGSLVEVPLPDHRPLPVPVGPSYALLAGFPLFAWGMARAARRARPTVLLFHLIDFAAPLPAGVRDDFRMSLFTLSVRSERAKRVSCTRMLAFAGERFAITTTDALVRDVSAAVAA